MTPNEYTYRIFRPDLENPTAEDCYEPFRGQNLMPIPWVERVDVANSVLFLASDKARSVTGAAGGPGPSAFGQREAGHNFVELTQVTPVALL